MNTEKNKEKAKWLFLLFIAVACFGIALATNQILFNIIAIVLAVCIYHYGNPILFKEYDDRRNKKYQEAMKVRRAAQEALTSKRIFKK